MENIENEATIQDEEINIGLAIRPIEEELQLQELFLNHRPKYTVVDSDNIEIFGSDNQIAEMFKDWAGYMGEIQNPENTADNIFLTAKNKSAGGNAALYAPLDEVLSNARPVLSKYGFGFFQSPIAKTSLASVKTMLTHKSGAFISFPALSVPTGGNTAQMIIAGITYARRGAINPIIGTHGESDDDGNTISGNDDKSASERKKNKGRNPETKDILDKRAAIKAIGDELKAVGVDKEVIHKAITDHCKVLNFNSVSDISLLSAAFDELTKIRTGLKKEGK